MGCGNSRVEPNNMVKLPETPPVWDQELMATVDKTIGPVFIDDPLVRQTGSLQGKQYNLTMSSADSKIYPGVVSVTGANAQLEKKAEDHECHGPFGGIEIHHVLSSNSQTPEISKPEAYERPLQVFVPDGVDTSQPSPFMIFLDGCVFEKYAELRPYLQCLRRVCCCCCSTAGGTAVHAIKFMDTMDKLFKAKQLKPIVCIFLDPGKMNGPESIIGTQRNLEYDSVSNTFAEFVEQEVLPFVCENCDVKLTTDPNQRAVMGMSSGGNAAITMGLTGRFNRILTHSPSCTNLGYPYNPQAPLAGWEYHSGKELIKNRAKVEGLRVVICTNEFDLMYQSDVKHSLNWVAASLRTAKALKEKGYDCLHIFSKEGIHVDPRVMAQCFPEAVKWIWEEKKETA